MFKRNWGQRAAQAVVGAALFASASSYSAVLTTYTSRAAWSTAAASALSTEDFADATLAPGLSTANGSIGGVFSGTASTQFNDAGNPRWNFAPGSTAVGADFDFTLGGAGDGIIFAITFADNSLGSAFVGNPVGGIFQGFFGFVSDVAITGIRFDSPFTGVENFTADDLQFAVAGTSVPEPGTLALLGAALLGGVLSRRRKAG